MKTLKEVKKMKITVNDIRSFFVGRSDAYGLYPNSIHPNNKPFKKEALLTDEIIKQHLDRNRTIGIYYAYKIEEVWYCGFSTMDIDLHGETNVQKIKNELDPLIYHIRKDLIKHYNIKPNNILRDFSGEGYHISIKFTKKTTLTRAHDFVQDLKRFLYEKYGLNEEIFPKQAILEDNGYGNFVKLPLSFNRKNGEFCEILDDFDLSKQGEGYKIPKEIPHYTSSQEVFRTKENKKKSKTIKIEVKDENFKHFLNKLKPCLRKIALGSLITHDRKEGKGHYMNMALCNALYYLGASRNIRIKAFERQSYFNFKKTEYYVRKLEEKFIPEYATIKCETIQEKGLCIKNLRGDCHNEY